jgi:DNA-directed RNA polymerase specialized sigma24 family protein
MALRRKGVRRDALDDIIAQHAGRHLSGGGGAGEDLLEALRDCVATLGERAGQFLSLFYREQRPARDAARALRTSEGAFYTTLTRIRRMLRRCVEERMGEKWA